MSRNGTGRNRHPNAQGGVLASALAAVVSVGAVPLPGAADPAGSDEGAEIDPVDITVETPRAAEQARVEARALTNDDVQAIRNEFIREGWTPAGDRVTETHNDETGESAMTVTWEFSVSGSDEQATIVYMGQEATASGLHSEHVDLSGDGESDHYHLTSYTVSGGAVVTETETDTVENFRGCSNVNWNCVFNIAARYSLIVPACVPCAAGKIPFCVPCIGAGVVAIDYADSGCHWCHD